MIRRFQIEDLIIQDTSGVVFRALDAETGNTAAVRRFFPFGVDGGGLSADEQTAYDIAIGRLAGLSHPALRSIIAGACDPVDGMPFIATEWIDGESLQSRLERGPLAAEAATPLILKALEVCELLSHVLAEEAVWVDTDPQTIIFGDAESGRPFTFWIAPLKWLGGNEKGRGLEAIVHLTEEIMGWSGRMVSDQAGRGLGGWLKWLRNAAATTTLQEAREALAASIGVDPPVPAKRLASRAALTAKPAKPAKKPKVFRWIGLVLVLIAAGLGGWLLLIQRAKTAAPPPPLAAPAMAEPVAPAAPPGIRNETAAKPAPAPATAVDADSQVAPDEKVFSPFDNGLLLSDRNTVVFVEGVVVKVDSSPDKKTVYLYFDENPAGKAVRGSMKTGKNPLKSVIDQFQPFAGKKVRIAGTVHPRSGSGLQRPDILIEELSDVSIAE